MSAASFPIKIENSKPKEFLTKFFNNPLFLESESFLKVNENIDFRVIDVDKSLSENN